MTAIYSVGRGLGLCNVCGLSAWQWMKWTLDRYSNLKKIQTHYFHTAF